VKGTGGNTLEYPRGNFRLLGGWIRSISEHGMTRESPSEAILERMRGISGTNNGSIDPSTPEAHTPQRIYRPHDIFYVDIHASI